MGTLSLGILADTLAEPWAGTIAAALLVLALVLPAAGLLLWYHVLGPLLIWQKVLRGFRDVGGRGMGVDPFVPQLGGLGKTGAAKFKAGISVKHAGRSTMQNFEQQAVSDALGGKELGLGCRAFEVIVTSTAHDVNSDVLYRHSYAFGKTEILRASLAPVVGERCSILLDGHDHAVRRRLLSPAFAPRNLRKLLPLFASAASKHVSAVLDSVVAAGGERTLDVVPVISRLTLEVIGTAALGGFEAKEAADGGGSASLRVAEALCGLVEKHDADVASNPMHLLLPRGWFGSVPTPSNLETQRRYKEICDITDGIIRARQQHLETLAPGSPRPHDILQLMLDAKDDTTDAGAPRRSRKLPLSEIRDEGIFLIFAGHDTTAVSINWALFLLTQFPEWARRAQREADEARAAGQYPFGTASSAASADPLRALPIINGVVMESLRLFPPVPLYSRMALEDVRVGDGGRLFIPRGACVAIPAGVVHRKEDSWPDAHAFDPARWMSDDQVAALGLRRLTSEEAHAWAKRRDAAGADAPTDAEDASVAHPKHEARPGDMSFVPFAGGASMCVGYRFGRTEAATIVTHMLAAFDMRLDDGYTHEPVTMATNRPRDGMRIRLAVRS